MFGRRSDGVELKTMPAEFKLMPMLMKERSDSQVFFNQDVPIEAIEEVSDYLTVPNLPKDSEFYALKVKGNSMIEDGIFDGDTVIIK